MFATVPVSEATDLLDIGAIVIEQAAPFLLVFRVPVAHCPITALPLIPHSQQRRVSGIDEINDPDICLGSVLTVEAAGILL